MASDRHGFIPSSGENALRYRVKVELRKRMRAVRKALPAEACAERSARIVSRLLLLEAIVRAKSVALFWPIEDRHEVDLRALDTLLRERRVRVAYPAVDPDTRAMTFRFATELGAMKEIGSGFCEPAASEPEATPGTLDAIVLPALAVDGNGYRIGYGAGYYDATLPVHSPPATTITVAFDFQLISEVPRLQGDISADWVVTDTRAFLAGHYC
jgi:5-formyltetrahydrofolate cyclo-ligase